MEILRYDKIYLYILKLYQKVYCTLLYKSFGKTDNLLHHACLFSQFIYIHEHLKTNVFTVYTDADSSKTNLFTLEKKTARHYPAKKETFRTATRKQKTTDETKKK